MWCSNTSIHSGINEHEDALEIFWEEVRCTVKKKIYIYIVLLRNMRGMLSKMKKNRGKWKKFVVYSRDIPEVLLKKRREPSLASKWFTSFFSFLARGTTTTTTVKTIASSHKTFRVRGSKRNTNVLQVDE